MKKLDDMYPKDPQINYHLGQVYIKLGHANLGFTHMTRATKLDPKGTAQQKGNFFDQSKSSKITDQSDSFAESSTLDSSTLENTNGGFDTTHEPSTYDIDLPGGEVN